MNRVKYISMLILALLAGCHAPRTIPIANNLAVPLSEADEWDLFALLEKGFNDEIETVNIGHRHLGFPSAIVHFAPKPLDVRQIEYKTCSVWHEDWKGGWGRILDVKLRKGKWYTDLKLRKTVKWQFDLKRHRLLIRLRGATYDEARDILVKIENGNYMRDPDSTDPLVEIDWNAVTLLEKEKENGETLYKIYIRTKRRYTGSYYAFVLRNGILYFTGIGMWVA